MNRLIRDYALIGDTRTAALVHRAGSIEWMCAPRFDSEPIFSSLLEPRSGGSFSLRVLEAEVLERRYDGATLVTTWQGPHGKSEVRDSLISKTSGNLLPTTLLVRELRCLHGTADALVGFDPTFGLPGAKPTRIFKGAGVTFSWDSRAVGLVADQVFDSEAIGRTRLSVDEGGSTALAMSVSHGEPLIFVSPNEAIRLAAEDTLWWRSWTDDIAYEGPGRDAVVRSLLVLRLLTYSPSGAPVAAPTTSLPEWIGSFRNWDYRYSWPRDAGIGLSAFLGVGRLEEAQAFMGWLLHAARVTRPRIEAMYTLDGNRVPPEREVDVDGFEGSRPVHVGNGARDQLQLDVYGWVIDAFSGLVRGGEKVNHETIRAMRSAVDLVTKIWSEPDNGIWEVRGERRNYVHSKMMCWLTVHRAIQSSRVFGERRLPRWIEARDQIAASIRKNGFDTGRGIYLRSYDAQDLDASILLPLPDFEPDPRVVRRTIDAIREELGAGGPLLYRFIRRDERGPEGAFLACTFWLIRSLARTGQVDAAEELFEEGCGLANDVGLYPEEIEPQTGEFLGNFPQALTHGSLVLAAQAIAKAREGERTIRG